MANGGFVIFLIRSCWPKSRSAEISVGGQVIVRTSMLSYVYSSAEIEATSQESRKGKIERGAGGRQARTLQSRAWRPGPLGPLLFPHQGCRQWPNDRAEMPRDLVQSIRPSGDYPLSWTGIGLLARYRLSGWIRWSHCPPPRQASR